MPSSTRAPSPAVPPSPACCGHVGRIADDRLQHVGRGHHAFEAAVLVQHQRQAERIGLQPLQRVQRGDGVGHHDRLAQRRRDRQLAAVEDAVQQVLRLHHADHVVDRAVAHHEARVRRRLQRGDDVRRGVGAVDPGQLGARRHDGAHRLVGQPQHALDHVALLGFQHAGLRALGEQRLQLLLGHHLRRRRGAGRTAAAPAPRTCPAARRPGRRSATARRSGRPAGPQCAPGGAARAASAPVRPAPGSGRSSPPRRRPSASGPRHRRRRPGSVSSHCSRCAAMRAPPNTPVSTLTRVMPTCTVGRKRCGSSASRRASAAPARPLRSSTARRARRAETRASSLIANTPFSRISSRMIRISRPMAMACARASSLARRCERVIACAAPGRAHARRCTNTGPMPAQVVDETPPGRCVVSAVAAPIVAPATGA